MSLELVYPEPMATVFMVDCPAGVILQIAAHNPIHATSAPILTVPLGIALLTAIIIEDIRVVVTMLEEKLVSIIATAIKNKTSKLGFKEDAIGDNTDDIKPLIPNASFVNKPPINVAAPVISIAPHITPFVVTSLKSKSLLPSTLITNNNMQPRSGGIAVVIPFINL